MDYNITYREKYKGIQLIISYKDYSCKWRHKSKQGFKKKSEVKNIAPGISGFGELKSKNSCRVVPIPNDTLELLQEFKKLPITDINNRILPYSQIQGLTPLLRKYLSKIGLYITIHELRHTYATMLVSNGINFKLLLNFLSMILIKP